MSRYKYGGSVGGTSSSGITKIDFAAVGYNPSPNSFVFNQACAVNDAIVVGLVSYSATSTVASVTCTGESNLTAVDVLLRPAGGLLSDGAIQLYYLQKVTAAGTKTITLNLSAGTNCEVGGFILRGCDNAAMFVNSGTIAQNVAISINTSNNNDAVIVFSLCQGGNSGDQGSFLYNAMPRNLQLDAMYTNLQSGAAGSKTFTSNGTGNELLFAGVFKAA